MKELNKYDPIKEIFNAISLSCKSPNEANKIW